MAAWPDGSHFYPYRAFQYYHTSLFLCEDRAILGTGSPAHRFCFAERLHFFTCRLYT